MTITAIETAFNSADFCYRASGDCMAPIIEDGDYVFIKKQNTANNGEIVAVNYKGSPILKRFYKNDDGDFLLVPQNRRYAPISATAEEIQIIGIAVGFQRALR